MEQWSTENSLIDGGTFADGKSTVERVDKLFGTLSPEQTGGSKSTPGKKPPDLSVGDILQAVERRASCRC